MKRIIDHYLLQWKNNTYNRKSLLIYGARQIGKTYAVRQFGKTYEDFVEINLELEHEAHSAFTGNLYPDQMLEKLKIATGKTITPGKTLLFIDEIQIVPRAIIALRYFYEIMPELHVIATGSLLDFAIELVGVPVGRVEGFYMRPLSFIEFFAATQKTDIVHTMLHHDPKTLMDHNLHENYLEAVNTYLAIGGMPEAVQTFIQEQDLEKISTIHKTIIDSYRKDFHTYAQKYQMPYVEKIFTQIPEQLGQKFNYTHIDGDYKKRELAPALDLLVTAGITHKVYYTAAQGLPFGGQRSDLDFKLLFIDTGLAQTMLGNDLTNWTPANSATFSNKGPLIESFIGQEIAAHIKPTFQQDLHYWHKDSAPQAEIDYLIDINYQAVPIEVKAGQGSTLHSLHYFLQTHKKSPYGIRFSMQNYSIQENIHSYPLYAVAQVMAEHNKEMKAAIENLL